MDTKPLVGLAGVLIAAMGAGLNDQVSTLALVDIRGGLGISSDAATWLTSLYLGGEVVGMVLAPWFALTVTLKRMALFAVALAGASTLLVPCTGDLELIYALRVVQGLSTGLTIPLLMITALRFLPPAARLYGLAAYALTATFSPNLATSLAALWTDAVGDWRFVFLEALPVAACAAVLIWWGLPDEAPKWERVKTFDWRGASLFIVGAGSLVTLLEQGDRLDWFASPLIVVLALVGGLAVPLFFLNELVVEVPLLKLQMLARRNFAYGVFGLFAFLLVSLAASQIPILYLQLTQGYRPAQSHVLTLEIALLQLVALPSTAWLLDHRRIDSRWVSAAGLALIFTACLGEARIDGGWNRDQFYLWQVLQGVGAPLVVVPLLMMATNAVKPEEAPFASAMVNAVRAVAEVTGVWLIALLSRWRGALHSARLTDQIGQNRLRLLAGARFVAGEPAQSRPTGGAIGSLAQAVERQVVVLTVADMFMVVSALVVVYAAVLLVLPERAYPPRIALAAK